MRQVVEATLHVSRARVSTLSVPFFATLVLGLFLAQIAGAQSRSYTSLSGTVVDSSGAVVKGAIVEIQNPVSQFQRTATTDSSGAFSFENIPFNPYIT
jgi:hypothetical protein